MSNRQFASLTCAPRFEPPPPRPPDPFLSFPGLEGLQPRSPPTQVLRQPAGSLRGVEPDRSLQRDSKLRRVAPRRSWRDWFAVTTALRSSATVCAANPSPPRRASPSLSS